MTVHRSPEDFVKAFHGAKHVLGPDPIRDVVAQARAVAGRVIDASNHEGLAWHGCHHNLAKDM